MKQSILYNNREKEKPSAPVSVSSRESLLGSRMETVKCRMKQIAF